MAVGFVTPVTSGTADASAPTLAMVGVTTGQPIVLVVENNGDGTQPAISDNFATPYTWTLVETSTISGRVQKLYAWIGTGGAGTSGTITVTFSGTQTYSAWASACTGASTAAGLSAVDKHGNASGSASTTLSSVSLTPSSANGAAVYTAGNGAWSSINAAPGAPWSSQLAQFNVSVYTGAIVVSSYPAPPASALTTSWTQSASVAYATIGLVILPGATVPAAPTLGTITPGNAQLSAAFTAGSDGGSTITTYKYSTDNGATYRTRQTGTTASPIVITTLSADGTNPLSNGTSYTVLIKAVNAVGDGTASNAVSATPSTTPSAPTLGTITPSNASLSAAFTAGATGGSALTSYKYSTDNGVSYLTRQDSGGTSSPIVITHLSTDGTTVLTNGVTYQVKIKAVNANGDGAASNEVDGTPATTPSAPTALIATGGNAQVSVAFTAGATGGSAITSYKYSTDNGASYLMRQSGTTASPVVITTLSSDGTTPLSNGVTYQIRLKAVNVIGDGTASSAVSGTPSNPTADLQAALTMRVGGL